ncbi:MAG TPA: ABC transporter ATP-binding protein [Gemmatimonadales bacterium]|nr:ABC transporter ATP-binding protein [Gemmatimonadales bacterium]
MIVLDRVAKRFGDRLALAELSLRVGPGEVVALVGPNGAGKSTALRILAGVIRPTAGDGAIGGWDVVRHASAARRQLGYLPQKLGIPPATVVGDLAALFGAVRGVKRADAVRQLAELGLGDRLGATLAQLSGGQRQRVMLALATLGPVTALLLDEPSISLDVDGAEEVRQAIRDARRRGVAVLFASHHLHDVAALADRIVVMVDGRAIAHGTLDELATAAGLPRGDAASEAPIDKIYRVLVTRGRAALRLVEEDAA